MHFDIIINYFYRMLILKKKLIFILSFFFICLFFTYVILTLIENRKKEHLDAEKKIIEVTYNTIIESYRVYSNIIYFNKLNTKETKAILENVYTSSKEEQEKIRKELYEHLIDMYNNMDDYKLKQLHFHLKNNDSFLRFHRPNKFGDNLTNIRNTVAYPALNVKIAGSHAGISVGEDGATHHGVFDIAYLNCIPNMIIAAPKDEIELRNIMFTASEGLNHPIAIRYPRGRSENVNWEQPFEKMEIEKIRKLQKGSKVAILSTGTIGNNVTKALKDVENSKLYSHYHFPFIKPLDIDTIKSIVNSHDHIITIEDGIITGGFGEQISAIIATNNLNKSIINLGIPDSFIEHGTVFDLQQLCKIDVNHLKQLFNTYSDV